MKRYIVVINILLLALTLIACGKKDGNERNTTTQMSNMDIMISANESEEKITEITAENEVETTEITTTEVNYEYFYYPSTESHYEEEELFGEPDPNVDVDLTVMGPNMIYAQINSMMMDPDSYLGQIIKLKGEYYPYYHESNGNYYHYVMIKDALACCQNGMEFIWDEGAHIFPDEYPQEDETIIICGEFKCYDEDNYTFYYLDIDEYTIVE